MNTDKLDGTISAIDQEVLGPAPSHSNLARLTSKALRELKDLVLNPDLEAKANPSTGSAQSSTVTVEAPTPENEPKSAKTSTKSPKAKGSGNKG